MSEPFELEIEAEAVEASHLVRSRCACGVGGVLCTPEIAAARTGRCEGCLREAARVAIAAALPEALRGIILPPVFEVVRQDPPAAEERALHPEPEHVGGWGIEIDVTAAGAEYTAPTPVLSLAEVAREAGWEVEMRYARGNGMHASQGRALGLQHSIALRFGGHPMTDRTAVAVYTSPVAKLSWSWSSVWVMGPDLPPCGALGVTELTLFLERPDELGVEWFAEQVRRRLVQAEASRERARQKPCAPDCEVDHVHKAAPKKREVVQGL